MKASGENSPSASPAGGDPAHDSRFHILFLIWRLHERPTYGYALLKEIKQMAVGRKKTSTIYATLGKLEKSGLVKSHMEKGGARMRRQYQTTAKGWALFRQVRKKMIRGTLREFMKAMVN